MHPIVATTTAMLVASVALLAQDRAAPPAVDERAALIKLQSATGSLDGWEPAIAAMLDQGRFAAASWWLDMADERQKGRDLRRPSSCNELRLRLKKAPPAVDAVLVNKLLIRAESAAVNKDAAGAARLVDAVKALLAASPDPAPQRRLAALEKAAKPGGEGASKPAAGSKAIDDLVAEAREALHGVVASWLREYEASGCRVGRKKIEALAAATAAIDGAKPWLDDVRARLQALVPSVEPSRSLTVFLRTRGSVSVYRNGLPVLLGNAKSLDGWEGKPAELKVFADDVIQFVLSEPYAEIENGQLFLAAASVRLDGADVPAKSWKRNASGDPAHPQPKLVRLEPSTKRKTSESPAPKGISREITADVERIGYWIAVPSIRTTSSLPCTVPLYDDLRAFEKAFADLGLPLTWLGLEADHLVLALSIPVD